MTAGQLDLLDLIAELDQEVPSGRLLFVATLSAGFCGGFPVPAIVAGWRPGHSHPMRVETEGGSASGQLTWRIHDGRLEIRSYVVEKRRHEYIVTDRIDSEESHDFAALIEWADQLGDDTKTKARAIADRSGDDDFLPVDWRILHELAARAIGNPGRADT